MKYLLKSVLAVITVLFLLVGVITVPSAADGASYNEAKNLINGIINYNLNNSGSASIENWISGSLSKNPGGGEWYALTLSQYGNYNFSAYKSALVGYLNNNKIASASSRQKYALVLISVGGTDKFIYDTLNDSIGKQGIMSYVFGLHLLNNGYKSEEHTKNSVKEKLLSLRRADGGWSVTGTVSDVDTTAMVIQALSPYYGESSVRSAVDGALSLLSSRQDENGVFSSYGVKNAESTAQVLMALSSLGIDFKSDGRFIKNGNTVLDAIQNFRLSDGSFSHSADSGTDKNATVQVFYSLVSYKRMCEGKTAFYILDKRNPASVEAYKKSETEPVTQNSSATASPDTKTGDGVSSEKPDGENPSDKTEDNILSDGVSEENATQKTAENDKTENKNGFSGNYRFYALSVILLSAIIICAVMFFMKKRNIRNYIFVLVVAILLSVIVFITNIQSVDDFYNSKSNLEDSAGTVTLSIYCNTTNSENDRIIVDKEEIGIKENSTVYDVLLTVTANNKIQLETNGSGTTVYVKGIDNLYEFDYGELSGWMYKVNGISPSVGCGEYSLNVGDEIEWYYTTDMGRDEIK